MENKEMAEIFAKPLHDTLCNAKDTENLVHQAEDFSNKESCEQVIAMISKDKDIDWERKVELIQKVNSEYDQRIENNIRRIKDLRTHNIIYITGICFIFYFTITPVGRKAIFSVIKCLHIT